MIYLFNLLIMKLSYGFIETKGFIAAIEAADAMLKAAKVKVVKWHKPGGALVTVVVEGELGACQAAVNAGSIAADRIGQLISAHVIPRPFNDTELLITEHIGGRKKRHRINKTRKTTQPFAAPVQPQRTSKKPNQHILDFFKDKPQGATLREIADLLNKPVTETRLLLKELMDNGQVEKIKQLYFGVGRRGRR